MNLRELALQSTAWPFQEAQRLLTRYPDGPPGKGAMLFETGYGASGLPHIGTFAEVARTTMVRNAFAVISDWPTRLVAFSDDMDGLRKVPDNVPNQAMMAEHLQRPVSDVPDPFGTHESFGAHNNARLRAFLDRFEFDYEFISSTESYRGGLFDDALLEILRHYEEIRAAILPTLGEERQRTYSPFLPVCEKTGQVLQVPILETDAERGTITFNDLDGERQTVPVTGGRVKCQWKVDWAMRWQALKVDYEMSGKDLIESVRLSSKVQRILGGRPPEGLTYELFLDDNGEKISKSKGNGLTIDQWLTYASPESLSWYMYQSPKRAKRLFFDVIPRTVDDYFAGLERYSGEEPDKQLANPIFHIHGSNPPGVALPVSFALLLNLVSATHTRDKTALWGFVERYSPGITAETVPELDQLLDHALAYYEDFVAPNLAYRSPTEQEAAAFADLVARLRSLPADADAEALQYEVYEAGKAHGFENLRDWFGALYECLLGTQTGPRMGSFIALYGIEPTLARIEAVLAGESPG